MKLSPIITEQLRAPSLAKAYVYIHQFSLSLVGLGWANFIEEVLKHCRQY